MYKELIVLAISTHPVSWDACCFTSLKRGQIVFEESTLRGNVCKSRSAARQDCQIRRLVQLHLIKQGRCANRAPVANLQTKNLIPIDYPECCLVRAQRHVVSIVKIGDRLR